MVLGASSPKYSLDTLSPKLSSVLQALYEEEEKKKPGAIPPRMLLHELPGDADTQEAMLMGALTILRAMGLIRIDAYGRVMGISRNARYALGSLSKFLSASVPAADERVDDREKAYLISLTKALESARVEKAQVSHEPLHTRRIVNVLIKSRQIRHWKPQDVYLHVYHPQWKQYHLVGLSHKDDSKTDEEIAKLALEKQVGLTPDLYVLDTVFNPPEVTDTRISATSGALTEYTLRLMAVKEIRGKLSLQGLLEARDEFDRDWFRWFTWEEIRQRKSDQGEPIMFSTPIVMEGVDRSSIPLSAPNADDMRASVRVVKELGNNFTYAQLLALTGALVLLLLLQFLPYILSWLGHPNPKLTNMASIAQITGTLIALGGVLTAVVKQIQK